MLFAGSIPFVIFHTFVSFAIFWLVGRCQVLSADKWIHLCATASCVMVSIMNAHEDIERPNLFSPGDSMKMRYSGVVSGFRSVDINP